MFFYTNSILNKPTGNKFLSLIILSYRFKVILLLCIFIDCSIDFFLWIRTGHSNEDTDQLGMIHMLCLKKCFIVIHSSFAWPKLISVLMVRVFYHLRFFIYFLIIVLLQLSQTSLVALLCPAHHSLPQSIPTFLSMSMGYLYLLLD